MCSSGKALKTWHLALRLRGFRLSEGGGLILGFRVWPVALGARFRLEAVCVLEELRVQGQ